MTYDQFQALWDAGGPVAVGLFIVVAAIIYDKRKPAGHPPDNVTDALKEVSGEIKSMRNEVTDRLARAETRHESMQHQIDRIERDMK